MAEQSPEQAANPSGPLRAITLVESRTGSEYRFLGPRLLDNGDLLIEGQDIGSTAEELFGEREVEVEYRVEAEHVPAVLLWLLKERFTSGIDYRIDFRAWLQAHNIPYRFTTY